jgi:hypothetical protein
MRRAARRRHLLLAALAPLVAGCFTAEAVLRDDWSGTLELTYVPGRHATIDSETARFSSAHVTVEAVEPRPEGALLRAAFDDVAKLSTAEGLAEVAVVRRRGRRRAALRIVIRNPSPRPFADHGEPSPRIALTLPGPVGAASAGAEIAGRRVVWRVPLAEYVSRPRTALSVRWAVPQQG